MKSYDCLEGCRFLRRAVGPLEGCLEGGRSFGSCRILWEAVGPSEGCGKAFSQNLERERKRERERESKDGKLDENKKLGKIEKLSGRRIKKRYGNNSPTLFGKKMFRVFLNGSLVR